MKSNNIKDVTFTIAGCLSGILGQRVPVLLQGRDLPNEGGGQSRRRGRDPQGRS
jgi:hypothetical protein